MKKSEKQIEINKNILEDTEILNYKDFYLPQISNEIIIKPISDGFVFGERGKSCKIIGGHGHGIELIYSYVTDEEYKQLCTLCQKHNRPISILKQETAIDDKMNLIQICCAKEIYYLFKEK